MYPMQFSADVIPPLTLLVAAGFLTFARHRVAPATWRLMNYVARYGALWLASVLSLAYTIAFAAGPYSPVDDAKVAAMKMASVGLFGLATGFLIVGSLLLKRGKDDDYED
jgi:hypothetical protein